MKCNNEAWTCKFCPKILVPSKYFPLYSSCDGIKQQKRSNIAAVDTRTITTFLLWTPVLQIIDSRSTIEYPIARFEKHTEQATICLHGAHYCCRRQHTILDN
jgi:hypothetical protein